MQKNPYVKTEWHDHIVDITLPVSDPNYVIQEGTRFNEARANNIEEGIYGSFALLVRHDADIQKLRVQMELDGRAPGNSGAYFDDFLGTPNKLIRQTAVAVLTAPRSAGTTVLNVDTTVGFVAFTEVTVYDGTNSEDVLITDVTVSTITVQPLVNDYVKGARIVRSNVSIADGQMLIGSWGTYSVGLMEVV